MQSQSRNTLNKILVISFKGIHIFIDIDFHKMYKAHLQQQQISKTLKQHLYFKFCSQCFGNFETNTLSNPNDLSLT